MDGPLSLVKQVEKSWNERRNVRNTNDCAAVVDRDLGDSFKGCISGQVILKSVIVNLEDLTHLVWLQLSVAHSDEVGHRNDRALLHLLVDVSLLELFPD